VRAAHDHLRDVQCDTVREAQLLLYIIVLMGLQAIKELDSVQTNAAESPALSFGPRWQGSVRYVPPEVVLAVQVEHHKDDI